MSTRPLPRLNDFNRPFFCSDQDELILQECLECKDVIYFPRVSCTSCSSTRLGWKEVSPYGQIYSHCLVHRPQHEYFYDKVPIPLIAVLLDAGPMVISNLVNFHPDQVKIGTRVKALRRKPEGSDLNLLFFEPVEA